MSGSEDWMSWKELHQQIGRMLEEIPEIADVLADLHCHYAPDGGEVKFHPAEMWWDVEGQHGEIHGDVDLIPKEENNG